MNESPAFAKISNTLPKRSSTSQGRGSSRLLRRTFILAFMLICAGLITSGATEVYFRYQESIRTVGTLQREMALGAAFKIQQFVKDIEKTMRAGSQGPDNLTEGLSNTFRFQMIKLLKFAPAISTATAVDRNARERFKVSRVEMVLETKKTEYESDPAFLSAMKGVSYFGSVYFVRQSEPHIRIAVPIEWFAGDVVGALIAEVNLKYIWDVVSSIKVGKKGYAYVVSQSGELIAYPDISLVLQKRNLKELYQVQAALRREPVTVESYPNLAGQSVFFAHAPIPTLNWVVIVERPVEETYELLFGSVIRSMILLLLGLGAAVLASLLIDRRVVRPLRVLREGATRIGEGALDHRIDLKTGDELEVLAGEFNHMAERLGDFYTDLEGKVEERTRELAESLERQTAVAEILDVISSSPTDTKPVFETILDNSLHLCDAGFGGLFLFDGERWRLGAASGNREAFQDYWNSGPKIAGPNTVLGRLQALMAPVQIGDVLNDVAYAERDPMRIATAEAEKIRTLMGVPIIKESELRGAIMVYRREVSLFSEKQIDLLKTFADQAAIAMDNAQLLEALTSRTEELADSVAHLQALHEVGRAVSSTLDMQEVLAAIVSQAVQISGTDAAVIYQYNEEEKLFEFQVSDNSDMALSDVVRGNPVKLGEGLIGRASATRQPVQAPDLQDPEAKILPTMAKELLELGYHSTLGVPLLAEQRIMGGLVVFRRERGEFEQAVIDVFQAFASQSVMALQNARLFEEIEERGKQLEIASRHKSQFLANMSHELRTPLNAILGYTELILDSIYGDIPENVREVLDRVHASGQHLLGLINDVLDLSKIEAGQLELSVAEYSMQDVAQNVHQAVESLAAEKSLALEFKVGNDLPVGTGDVQRITQVLLNLLGNAIKFSETGRIVTSFRVEESTFFISVADNGPGIAPDDLLSIFDEFHQADSSSTKIKGGTGLGLAIAKRFIEMHGGKIWAESTPGEGATFCFTLPVRLPSIMEAI